jgi:hypothetical protein
MALGELAVFPAFSFGLGFAHFPSLRHFSNGYFRPRAGKRTSFGGKGSDHPVCVISTISQQH